MTDVLHEAPALEAYNYEPVEIDGQINQDNNGFGLISKIKRNVLRFEVGVAALAGVSTFIAAEATATAKETGKAAQIGRVIGMERIEELVITRISESSQVASIALGGIPEGYHYGNPNGFSIGPQLIDFANKTGHKVTTTSIGDVSKVLVKRHMDTINGPCTFNGNENKYVYTFPHKAGYLSCGNGVSKGSAYSISIVNACKNVVSEAANNGEKISLQECEKTATNFTSALNTTGDEVAAAAGFSKARYDVNGVSEIEVISDPVIRVVHSGPNTIDYAVSDNPVSATITFSNDHKPGRQIHRIIEENVGGHTVEHVQWF